MNRNLLKWSFYLNRSLSNYDQVYLSFRHIIHSIISNSVKIVKVANMYMQCIMHNRQSFGAPLFLAAPTPAPGLGGGC